ncbi:MAG TPA: hypothetical protein VEX60_09985 [Pyrinomonadaceae bacterium]|nr:hypothetical protein [Pyrinomonadaceae bacterium]
MYPTDLVNLGLTRSEIELRMLETALGALTVWALATIAVASFVYFLLWLNEARRVAR